MPGLTVAQARQRQAIIDRANRKRVEDEQRHAKHLAAWETESRDAEWAEAQEEDLRQLMVDSGVDHLLVGVDCRSTMCRLEAEILDTHSYFVLMSVPGLIDSLGGEQASYSTTGQPAERTLVLLTPPGTRYRTE